MRPWDSIPNSGLSVQFGIKVFNKISETINDRLSSSLGHLGRWAVTMYELPYVISLSCRPITIKDFTVLCLYQELTPKSRRKVKLQINNGSITEFLTAYLNCETMLNGWGRISSERELCILRRLQDWKGVLFETFWHLKGVFSLRITYVIIELCDFRLVARKRLFSHSRTDFHLQLLSKHKCFLELHRGRHCFSPKNNLINLTQLYKGWATR